MTRFLLLLGVLLCLGVPLTGYTGIAGRSSFLAMPMAPSIFHNRLIYEVVIFEFKFAYSDNFISYIMINSFISFNSLLSIPTIMRGYNVYIFHSNANSACIINIAIIARYKSILTCQVV